jgi:N-acyl-D-aspartate/D-glutamate deacylase
VLDVVIAGGEVVDGTGRARYRADVGLRDGLIVAIGDIDEAATTRIEAEGRVVAPGIVDIHTHYDAQAFWDGTLSPSPLHGVTTVVGGNCGFSIAPLAPSESDYMMRMLARVEGMPLESLRAGVPWDWSSTADYLARLEGQLSINAGFLVGHSAIRRVVMGEAATGRAATDAQIEAMSQLLAAGLEAGGLGFSSSWGEAHNDADGNMVPSRYATEQELVRLSQTVYRFPGTTLEFIPTLSPFEPRHLDLMARMSAAADRPLNWNALGVSAESLPAAKERLRAGDYARERGGRVVALTLPMATTMRLSFENGFLLDALPGWAGPMALPAREKLALLSSAAERRRLDQLAQQTSSLQAFARWGDYIVMDTVDPSTARYRGATVAEIAAQESKDPFDALLDIVVADRLKTAFRTPLRANAPDDWRARVEVWRDERAVLGASDAGAHLDLTAQFNYATEMIANAVRRLELLSLEEALRLVTDIPARLYGLAGRGRVAEGWSADLVVFDPATIASTTVETRRDLPGGAARLYTEAVGIDHVIVNGSVAVQHGSFTEARSGRVLRSGRDTVTVAARS